MLAMEMAQKVGVYDENRERNVYDAASRWLEPEEMMMLPETYVDNNRMFDRVCGVAYIIRDKRDPQNIDWMFSSRLTKTLQNHPDIEIVEKVIIARLRLPWNEVETEWTASEEDLEEWRDDWEILETYLWAIHKDDPDKVERLLISPEDKADYEQNPDHYTITRKKYQVAWKMDPETRQELLRRKP